MVRGWPANSEYAIPVSEAPNRDSMALWETSGEREESQTQTVSSPGVCSSVPADLAEPNKPLWDVALEEDLLFVLPSPRPAAPRR